MGRRPPGRMARDGRSRSARERRRLLDEGRILRVCQGRLAQNLPLRKVPLPHDPEPLAVVARDVESSHPQLGLEQLAQLRLIDALARLNHHALSILVGADRVAVGLAGVKPGGLSCWSPPARLTLVARSPTFELDRPRSAAMRAETTYARSGDLHIAYQVTGDGPLDLVFVPGFASHLEYEWEEPPRVRITKAAQARYMAERIPEAKCVELLGDDHVPWIGDADAILTEIEELLTGSRPTIEPDRVLATVLFTDIVGSTKRAADLGDRRWRDLLDRHHVQVRRELVRFRGREVKTAGDGFLATFDGPARAIHCAGAIGAAVRQLGLEIRAGLHTGEVELIGDDVGGIAVHIGARVAAEAGPGEILVSSTVKDLVAGSGIRFDDRNTHALRGIPGEWRLFAVERGSAL
ncbi:MAG: adenylate/guanylate cyclase domain-containing protein [Chloroflexi bacterium]|nr:adenylate/guanylate cyclase domain-containing protein [Chloroflexota bacterium]